MIMYYSKLEVVLVELYLLVERLTNLTFPSTSSKVFPYFWTHIFIFLIFCFCQHRRKVVKLLEETRDHLYQANHTWVTSIRKHLRRSLLDGLTEASTKSKSLSVLSHPVPECSCLKYDPTESYVNASSPSHSQLQATLGAVHHCPAWMDSQIISRSKDKESEEDLDEDDSSSSGLFFRHNGSNHESGGGEINKEEAQLEDQEEESGEK